MKAEALIALAERLRQYARQKRGSALGVDLRYAAIVIRHHAALLIAEEAGRVKDHARRRDLVTESVNLWRQVP